jgi:hypothetical protein
MIIEKKNPVFGRFGDLTPGTVFGDYYDGNVHEIYMKMQAVIISEPISNAVDIETGEWTFFGDNENIVPYTSARIILE